MSRRRTGITIHHPANSQECETQANPTSAGHESTMPHVRKHDQIKLASDSHASRRHGANKAGRA
ncbi:hypothetical protein MBR_09363, partial [Metarhizium brunneum ARSEF 3297]